MNAHLTPEFFAGRRERAFQEIGENALLILNAGPTTPNHVKFHQDSAFFYLTGFPEPNAAAALLNADGKQTFALFVPPKDLQSEIWDGERAGVQGALDRYNADQAFPLDQLAAEMPKLMDKAWKIYLRSDFDSERARQLHSMRRSSAKSSGRIGRGAIELADPDWMLAKMRAVKTKEETAAVRAAAGITAEAYAETVPQIRPGRYEYEIEALLNGAFRIRGADRPAYISIVGAGNNSTCLHYTRNSDPLRSGDLLLIDAAAMKEHYASDVTRTYPINGRFTPAQRQVYEAVLAAQKEMIEQSKPGKTLRQLHELSIQRLTQSMIDLGWLEKKPVEQHIEEKTYRKYYMHGSGHHLGLDVHDSAPAEIDGEPYALREGNIFTIEPGLYVSKNDESLPEEFRGFGVRIEDDILITRNGCENLTSQIPKEPDDVETQMR